MSEESFNSMPDVFTFDVSLLPTFDYGIASAPSAFRGRNTVSLSALTRVEPRFQKELLAALNRVYPGNSQGPELNQSSHESLRSRSSPAICSSHEPMNICHGSPSGFSLIGNAEPLEIPSESEARTNKIRDRLKFIGIIISILMIFTVLRFFGS